jgi:hypothetical protein
MPFALAFYLQVAAGSELHLECWDIPVAPPTRHRAACLGAAKPDIFAHSRFLGQANIPLSDTLPPLKAALSACDNLATVNRSYHLARRDGRDMVAGIVTLAFDWSVSATSLLRQRHRILEKVLMQRLEILAILSPMPVAKTRQLVCNGGEQSTHSRQTEAASSQHPSLDNSELAGMRQLYPVFDVSHTPHHTCM